MSLLCPTCRGKGVIPDPRQQSASMNYCGMSGETCPTTFCRTCGGSGWAALTPIQTQHVVIQNLRREPPNVTG
jgi:DnaJ-class molecular chaperone